MRILFQKRRLGALLAVLILALSMTFSYAGEARAATSSSSSTVHTIYWKVRMVKTIKTKYGTVKSGQLATVIYRYYPQKKSTILVNGHGVTISNKYFYWISDLCTGKKGDYSRAVKENFINKQRSTVTSKTRYLLWISLDKQRVNVFTGYRGHWRLYKTMKCATGQAGTPTITGNWQIYRKVPSLTGLKFFCGFQGNGFHVGWRSGGLGTNTASHGCVRLASKDAQWIYYNCGLGTRVVVY